MAASASAPSTATTAAQSVLLGSAGPTLNTHPHSVPPLQTAVVPASLVSPAALQLATTPSSQVDAQCFSLLVTEMIPIVRRAVERQCTRIQQLEADMRDAGLLDAQTRHDGSSIHDSTDADQRDGAVATRLEAIGHHVGANLADRLARDKPRIAEPLEVLKFVCKDVWMGVYDKQIDNLRTNHRVCRQEKAVSTGKGAKETI